MKNFILLSTVLLLGACGTTGPINISKSQESIPANKARIIITRNNSLLYLAATVNVRSNGSKIANLGRGGSVLHDIQKGKNTLSVSTPTAFGQFVVNFNAEAGKTYNFKISPRGGALASGSLWGMSGDAMNASVSEQSGYFQISSTKSQQ
jgi:hypothetical protein